MLLYYNFLAFYIYLYYNINQFHLKGGPKTMKLNTKFGIIDIKDGIIQGVIEGLPTSYNTLEKSIYIYIRICRGFSFSMSYFLEEMIEPHTFCHLNSDMDKLQFNNMTCHKFSVLFSSILRELVGIEAKIVCSNPGKDIQSFQEANRYGYGHQSVVVSFSNCSIWFDPLLSFLGPLSDFYNAKNGTCLAGIRCIYGDDEELESTIEKVYYNILERNNILSQSNLEGSCTTGYGWQDIITEFNNAMQTCSLTGMDLLSHMLTLSKRPTNDLVQISPSIIVDVGNDYDESISINISNKKINATWQFILTIKHEGIYHYFKYNKKIQKLEVVSKEVLRDNINQKKYLASSKFQIPGLDEQSIDFLSPFFEYFCEDELYDIENYIQTLPASCKEFLLDYLKRATRGAEDILSEIACLATDVNPCELDCIKKESCSYKIKCLIKHC